MWTACQCRFGFAGSGKFCYAINICLQVRTVQVQLCVICLSGGVTTVGEFLFPSDVNILLVFSSESNSRSLYGDGPFTIFVPLEKFNNASSYEEWKRSGRLDALVRYHIVSCELLRLRDLKSTKVAVSMSGHTLHFSQQQGSVWINNRSRIVQSDYVTFNGVIHHISALLTPYTLEDKPVVRPDKMDLTSAAAFYGYTRFYRLMEEAGLLPVFSMVIHQPFTMLWPTDAALSSLPAERQRWLSSPDHRDELVAIVKAHVIRNAKMLGLSQPGNASRFRSMHGSQIKFSCDKTLVGAVLINDAARIVDRYMTFQEGLAYGIDQLLEPPGLGAHCDMLENRTTYGHCGRCHRLSSCPFKHVDTGRWEDCLDIRPRRRGFSNPFLRYHYSPMVQKGCRRVCYFPSWIQKCCGNHYGRDCQVCPGGIESPCNNHGNCSDGILGSGKCTCNKGFKGSACDQCSAGYYGTNCTACDNCGKWGNCDDGIQGSGKCVCRQGWTGENCQLEIREVPGNLQSTVKVPLSKVKEGGCRGLGYSLDESPAHRRAQFEHLEAQYLARGYLGSALKNPFQRSVNNATLWLNVCQVLGVSVKLGFKAMVPSAFQSHVSAPQSSSICQAELLNPAPELCSEYNGGCHQNADCNQTGWTVNCTCQFGYQGDGFFCEPINRCIQEQNGGCSEFASCKFVGPNKRDCECLPGYVGNGVQCLEKVVPPVDRCLQDNGDCDPVATCKDLHYHAKTAGVFHLRSPSGKYKMNFSEADAACTNEGATLASFKQLGDAQQSLLDYSGSSSEGKELIDFLSHRTSEVTIFVPPNTGFAPNQTLSGRDLEYHISASQNRRTFKDLQNHHVIPTRLGYNLTISLGHNETHKMVNERLVLDWDIPASNGIIHIIEAPLMAPPVRISLHASQHQRYSSGTLSAISIFLLLMCILAGVGFSIFRRKTDAFRFHYFKNKDADSSTGVQPKPTLLSYPNPMYGDSRDLSELFGDQQEVQPAQAEEAPKILDLDG
ncbi:Stabilin-1 Fasciclin [Takifugu flavidus]|uniref:Stabilin-1 Fasciclin n=1 Tax=Takifugu flavidus TaxID=433684 RepID=A0A5C6N912_9TELE|nr:Stabilin-1 Fasciclin [Takifugu flavidus]